MALPKWTIDELKTKYELSPKLDDLFVEGNFDVDLFEAVYREKKCKRPIYPISMVDVSDLLLAEKGLTSGNKQRLIALFSEFTLPEGSGVNGLIDRDYDHFLGSICAVDQIIYTTDCDPLSSFFTKEIIEDVLVNAGGCVTSDFSVLFTSLIDCLKKLSSLRLALRTLDVNSKLVGIPDCLTVSHDKISIDIGEVTKRSLNSSANSLMIEPVSKSTRSWYGKLAGADERAFTRGHDLVSVLCWLIKKLGKAKSFIISEAIERLMIVLSPRVVDRLSATIL